MKELWSLSEFARCSGMHIRDVRLIVRSPSFYPAVRMGGRILIDTDRLHDWLQED